MLAEDPTIATGDYYEKLPKLKDSELYNALDRMPKPGLMHLHLTAALRVDWMVEKLCYYDFVYLNQQEGKFKVSKDPKFSEPGYIAVN